MTLRVERAAIRAPSGEVVSVEKPGRHHNVIYIMARQGYSVPISGQQGFLLSDGSFVGRREAFDIARKAGQLLKRAGSGPELFSEDVW